MKRLFHTTACFALIASGAAHAEGPAVPAPTAVPTTQPKAFAPPYPGRTNPFQLPNNTAALATRRDVAVQQIDISLKGFINVGDGVRAVVVLNGEVLTMGTGEQHGELHVLEIAPPTLTLQRGRHRWTESILSSQTAKSVAQNGNRLLPPASHPTGG